MQIVICTDSVDKDKSMCFVTVAGEDEGIGDIAEGGLLTVWGYVAHKGTEDGRGDQTVPRGK